MLLIVLTMMNNWRNHGAMIDRCEVWVQFANTALGALIPAYARLSPNGEDSSNTREIVAAAAAFASAMTQQYVEALAEEPKQLARPKRSNKGKGKQ